SETFRTMMANKMVESTSRVIDLSTYNQIMANDLLRYLYSRRTPDYDKYTVDHLVDFISMCNMYAIPGLLDNTIARMKGVFDKLDVAEQFRLADLLCKTILPDDVAANFKTFLFDAIGRQVTAVPAKCLLEADKYPWIRDRIHQQAVDELVNKYRS